MGHPPTGKSVMYNEIFILRFTSGRRSNHRDLGGSSPSIATRLWPPAPRPRPRIGCGTGQMLRVRPRQAVRSGSTSPHPERPRELAQAEGIDNITFEHATHKTTAFRRSAAAPRTQ